MQDDISLALNRLQQNLESVIVGKKDAIRLAILAFVCNGHILIEDLPGLGKTILARCLAKSISGNFKRIQFTPDLLPSDITGLSIYNQKSAEFEFRAGPVFCNVLLADEINRATPRTQSSLLEAMDERTVTADGVRYATPNPFLVIATQNPIEMKGTFPLPEAQLDRFFGSLSMGYPTVEEEAQMMGMQIQNHPIEQVQPVLSLQDLLALQEQVRSIHVEPNILSYIAQISAKTRSDERIVMGAGPRGSLALMRASQGMSLMKGENYVSPDTVKEVAGFVLGHRLVLKTRSVVNKDSAHEVVASILDQVEVPLS